MHVWVNKNADRLCSNCTANQRLFSLHKIVLSLFLNPKFRAPSLLWLYRSDQKSKWWFSSSIGSSIKFGVLDLADGYPTYLMDRPGEICSLKAYLRIIPTPRQESLLKKCVGIRIILGHGSKRIRSATDRAKASDPSMSLSIP